MLGIVEGFASPTLKGIYAVKGFINVAYSLLQILMRIYPLPYP